MLPKRFTLTYDSAYGLDRRSGWTVVIDGIVVVQFCKNPIIALLTAFKKWRERERE